VVSRNFKVNGKFFHTPIHVHAKSGIFMWLTERMNDYANGYYRRCNMILYTARGEGPSGPWKWLRHHLAWAALLQLALAPWFEIHVFTFCVVSLLRCQCPVQSVATIWQARCPNTSEKAIRPPAISTCLRSFSFTDECQLCTHPFRTTVLRLMDKGGLEPLGYNSLGRDLWLRHTN
jgi:hypothetical protein